MSITAVFHFDLKSVAHKFYTVEFNFFEHMATGVRHLVLDTGAGYELKRNKIGALACPIIALVLTAAFWLWMGLR